MESELKLFLSQRGISERIIENMDKEKIDMKVISLMSDNELSQWFNTCGDRCSVKHFCQRNMSNTIRKRSLLDVLRQKMNSEKNMDSENEASKVRSSSEKDGKQIELGWICKRLNEEKKQIRTKQGGGTRKIKVEKQSTKSEILNIAINLFFPNGISTYGPISNYDFDLYDFKMNVVPETIRLKDVIEITRFPIIRFYLFSTEKIIENIDRLSGNVMVDNEDSNMESWTSLNNENISTPTSSNNDLFQHFMDNTNFNVANEQVNHFKVEDNTDVTENDDIYTEALNIVSENSDASNETEKKTKLWVHRGHILDELIIAMEDLPKNCYPLQFTMILPNGEEEMGSDTGGVYRDVLSEFWEEFYERCTEGATIRTPCLRHDFGEKQWTAIAKILYKGWKEQNYFPIKLNMAFMEHCILGQITSNLTNIFLNYINTSDADTINKALLNFNSVNTEDLLESLDSFDCKWTPTMNNIIQLVADIAHKELIQKPMFIIKCFTNELKNMMTKEELHAIYTKLSPSPKNILAVLNYSRELDSQKITTVGYLKKFIKEADERQRSLFLRFCTGANILTATNINITFSSVEGLARTPIAHTCGCNLVLPFKYENFADFRSELNSILNSNVWVMDII